MTARRSCCKSLSGAAPRSVPALVLGLLTALSATGCELARPDRPAATEPTPQSPPLLTIVDGEDYALPSWVTSEPYSGYVNHPLRGDPAIGGGQRTWTVPWRDLEPVRGEYTWDAVDAVLDAAEAGGYTVSVRIKSIVTGGYSPSRGITLSNVVPDWVFEDFGITEDQEIDLGWEFNIRVIPAWRPEIREVFEDLIRAFGERGYPRRPGLGSAYVHAISLSRGEEFWLHPHNLVPLEEQAGLTPEVMQEWLSSRMQAYAQAFGSETYKVAWVGTYEAWRYSDPRYAQVAEDLIYHAWDLGMGVRHGGIERFFQCANDPAFGLSVDEQGYLTVDESIAPIATVRYYGDENESYGDASVRRYGSRSGEAHRYRYSMLSALQRRLRWLWTSAAAEEINPPLSEYARLSFGKTIENSPDAWAYLSETPARTSQSPVGAVKNFERWLHQRDVPGGMTVPTERVDRSYSAGVEPSGQYYDLTARRTDLEGDNPYIYFDLDDRFAVSGSVLIKVEFRDVGEAAWRIEYMDAAEEIQSTPGVQNIDDGRIRTATFVVVDACFAGGLPHGMDFRIVCDGPQDVTVRWVRVIRDSGP